MRRSILRLAGVPVGLLFLPWVVLVALVSRCLKKSIDVGLGPEPLINNLHHKKALLSRSFSAESFCVEPYFITSDFDKVFLGNKTGKVFVGRKYLASIHAYTWSFLRHKCHYLYFTGGTLGPLPFLGRVEPYLYKLAAIKTVLMPYGADVQTLKRTNNLKFKRALDSDYPDFHLNDDSTDIRVRMWERHADYIICGCDWIEFVDHWDRLMLAHFSIDCSSWNSPPPSIPSTGFSKDRPLQILHAPNHRNIKGSKHFINAVKTLQEEGYPIELKLIEKQPNEKVKEALAQADILADQLIIGMYAMSALEGMAMSRPVLCFIREDLEELYIEAGLISENEMPFVNVSPKTVTREIRNLLEKPELIQKHALKSRKYVVKHHSIEAVGNIFREINETLGICSN